LCAAFLVSQCMVAKVHDVSPGFFPLLPGGGSRPSAWARTRVRYAFRHAESTCGIQQQRPADIKAGWSGYLHKTPAPRPRSQGTACVPRISGLIKTCRPLRTARSVQCRSIPSTVQGRIHTARSANRDIRITRHQFGRKRRPRPSFELRQAFTRLTIAIIIASRQPVLSKPHRQNPRQSASARWSTFIDWMPPAFSRLSDAAIPVSIRIGPTAPKGKHVMQTGHPAKRSRPAHGQHTQTATAVAAFFSKPAQSRINAGVSGMIPRLNRSSRTGRLIALMLLTSPNTLFDQHEADPRY